jgi:hypothetical protein
LSVSELPILLEPGSSRGRTQVPGSAAPASTGSVPDRAGWPWWLLPARLIGQLRPAILGPVAADARAVSGLPALVRHIGLPAAVIALAVIAGSSRWLDETAYATAQVDWLRLQMDHAFADVPLFLLLACVLGPLSPGAAALFVAVFAAFDLVATTRIYGELSPFPWALLGRLVALWSLWLLMVEIPVLARRIAADSARLGRSRPVLALVAAGATGFLVWAWTQAEPVLLRPLYVWSGLEPALSAIVPVQQLGIVFAVTAGATAGAVAWRGGPERLVPAGWTMPIGVRWTSAPARVGAHLATAVLATIVLGGLVESPLDAIVLFAGFTVARPAARMMALRTPWGSVAARLPLVVRFVLAIAAVFTASIAMVDGLVPVDGVSEYFSVIAAIVVGWFLVELFMAPPGRAAVRASPARAAGVAALLALGLLALAVAAPSVALADNCSSFGDCWGVPFLAALVGGSIPFLTALSGRPPTPTEPDFSPYLPPIHLKTADQMRQERQEQQRRRDQYADKKKDWYDRELDRQRRDPDFPNNPGLQRQRENYLRRQSAYWGGAGRSSGPSSDGGAPSPQSFPSSGAGTKG